MSAGTTSPAAAQAALDAVAEIRTRASRARRSTTPWTLLFPMVAFSGLSVSLAMMESLWMIATLAVSIALAIVAHLYTRETRVRYAIKQPVRPDPPTSWTSLIPMLLIYPLLVFAPKGNPFLAAFSGLVATAVLAYLVRRNEQR